MNTPAIHERYRLTATAVVASYTWVRDEDMLEPMWFRLVLADGDYFDLVIGDTVWETWPVEQLAPAVRSGMPMAEGIKHALSGVMLESRITTSLVNHPSVPRHIRNLAAKRLAAMLRREHEGELARAAYRARQGEVA